MQSPETTEIQARFFEAIQAIKDCGFASPNAFCIRYGIDRRNLAKLKAEPHRKIFQPSWLMYLVRDYNINAEWLLTGHGDIFKQCTSNER